MIIEFKCEFCGKRKRVSRAKSRTSRPRFCSQQCKKDWTLANPQFPVTREWLYQKYIVEKLDCTQIGKLTNHDSKTVWNWLKCYGIPTRGRGMIENFRNMKQHGRLGKPGTRGMLGKTHSPESREKLRQARLKDGHVPYLKDGQHYLKGKRGAETPNWKGGITPERAKVYDSPEWKRAVKVVWKRDNATCQRCGLHRSDARKRGIDFDIHHIVSFAVPELRCEPNNLILLCEPCHYWVHSSKNVNKEFLK